MTESAKRLGSFHDEMVQELISRFQEMFARHAEMAFQQGRIDEFAYRKFLSEPCTATTREEVFDHYESMYNDLLQMLRNNLLYRIVRGAEFIESLDKNDPRYERAMAKYDRLVEELQAFDEREREHERQKFGYS